MTFSDWCIKAHADTNHMYDEYIPYEFHLKMTKQVAIDFQTIPVTIGKLGIIMNACMGHDLIEDTRKNYNDILAYLMTCDEHYTKEYALEVVEIIFALTNEKGRNRAERANAKYYGGIRALPLAKYIKMCDRIASVRYSILTKDSKISMHRKECSHFLSEMQLEPMYQPMIDHLDELLNK